GIFLTIAILGTAGVTAAYHGLSDSKSATPRDTGIPPIKGEAGTDMVLAQQQSDRSSGSSGSAGSSLRTHGQKKSGDAGSPGQLGKSSFASHGFGCTGGFGFGYGSGFGGGGGGGFGYGSGFGSGSGGGFGYGSGNGFSSGSGNGF